MYKHMIISPITKQELKLQVTELNQAESRDLMQSHSRQLEVVTAVPIILTFPFKAAIKEE